MSTGSITDRVRDIVEPLLTARHLELVDIEQRGAQLRVTVDRAGGIDLEAVSEATRVVSRALDEFDPIPGRYTLEVSSPGLERPLRTPAHFARAVGEQVALKLRPDVEPAGAESERRLRGVLTAADDVGCTVRVAPGDERRLAFADIEKARTVFEWGPAAAKPSAAGSRSPKAAAPADRASRPQQKDEQQP